MKRILFAIILNCCAAVIFAQDVIIMWDATEIEAKVLTIGVNDISYKKCTFQDGPTLPLKQDFSSFFEFSFGANILLLDSDLFSYAPVGDRIRLGAGIEYKRFVCGLVTTASRYPERVSTWVTPNWVLR